MLLNNNILQPCENDGRANKKITTGFTRPAEKKKSLLSSALCITVTLGFMLLHFRYHRDLRGWEMLRACSVIRREMCSGILDVSVCWCRLERVGWWMLMWLQMAGVQVDCRNSVEGGGGWLGLLFLRLTSANCSTPAGVSTTSMWQFRGEQKYPQGTSSKPPTLQPW